MTEAEYSRFLELEKDGKAKDFYESAYPEVRAEAEEYTRSLDVEGAATKGGKTSGENAPLVNGLDWAGHYKKVEGDKNAPTQEQLDAFRGKIASIVTGLKVDKDGNEYYYRGDPDDLYELAVKMGLYTNDPIAKKDFSEFLRYGNITEEEAKKNAESGEWDEAQFSAWLRAKNFADIRNDASEFARKRSARASAEKYIEENPVKSALAEFFLPSTMRTLKEGETPTRLQIGADAAVSALGFMPGVGAVARTPSALAGVLRRPLQSAIASLNPALKSASAVEKVSALLMPSLAGALTGANEYLFNGEDFGTAANDAAKNALIGLGGGAVNELGTLAVASAIPGMSRGSALLSRLFNINGPEVQILRQKKALQEAVGIMNAELSKAAKKKGREFVPIPEDATGEAIHNSLMSVYGDLNNVDLTVVSEALNKMGDNPWKDSFIKSVGGADPENLRNFSKTVVNYDKEAQIARADDIKQMFVNSADPEKRAQAIEATMEMLTHEKIAGRGNGGRIWKTVDKLSGGMPVYQRGLTAGFREAYLDGKKDESITDFDPENVVSAEEMENERKRGKFRTKDLDVKRPSPSIHDFYMEQLGKMMRQ